MTPESIMTATLRTNPYVGPRSYLTGETLYGRDSERVELLDLLIAERIVLLYSPSGAGKTSLIQAGLLPELTQEGFHVLPTMRVSAAPSDVGRGSRGAPNFSYNRYTLSLLLSLDAALPEVEQTPLAELATTLNVYLERRYPVHNGNESLVLIFDQFEEILTLDPTDQMVKAEFFAGVGEVLRNRNRWALFAMREEFVTALDPYVRLLPTRLSSTFRLELLGVEAALQAVRRPAEAAGTTFTEAAAKKLVSNLRRARVQEADGTLVESLGPTVEPVQLQVVCRRLWEKLPSSATVIEEQDIDEVGDVDSALRAYYAERVATIAEQTDVRERTLRDWIDRQLITESGIRGQVLQGKGESAGLSNAAIGALMDAHLVRAEKRRGATWFELVHDRLIDPVRADNADWRMQHLTELQRRADLWQRENRPEGLLMVGEELGEAETWAEAHGEELEDYEEAFLGASREAQTRRQRERRFMIGMGILTIIALGAAFVALFFFQDAQVQANAAREAEGKAVVQAEVAQTAEARAEQAQATAEVRRMEAERQSSISRAQVLRSLSQLQAGRNAECSLALALDAYDLAMAIPDYARYPFEDAVRDALLATRTEQVLPASYSLEAVDWSHDGRHVAVGETGGGTQVWTASGDGLEPGLRLADPDRVGAVAFSPDDSVVAVGSADIVLWDFARNEVVGTLRGHSTSVRSLAWHPGGRWLASGADDGLVIIWDAQEQESVVTLTAHQDQSVTDTIGGLVWSPDGNRLASAGHDNSTRIWDATKLQNDAPADRTPTQLVHWRVNEYGETTSLVWSPDGRHVASGQAGGVTLVWDLDATGELVDFQPPTRILEGHAAAVTGLAWSADGARLASSSQDQTIRLWDGETFDGLEVLTGHSDSVQAVAWHPHNEHLVSASFDSTLRVWRVTPGGVQLQTVGGGETYLLDAAWHPSHNIVALALASALGSPIRLWDLENNTTQTIETSHFVSIQRIAWSPNGEQIATAAADGEVHVYDVQSGSLMQRFTGHQGPVYEVTWSPDGLRLASGSHNSGENVRIWTLEDGSAQAYQGSDNIVGLAWRPNREQVAAGTVPGTINIWDLTTGERYDLANQAAAVLALAWHSSGQWLAAGLQNGRIAVWEIMDGDLAESRIWKDDLDVGEQIWDVAWHDNLLAAAAVDGPVRVWHVVTGENVANLSGHVGPVRAVGWSADGRYIVTVGMTDGTARVHYADFAGELLPIARQQLEQGSTEAERLRCRTLVE